MSGELPNKKSFLQLCQRADFNELQIEELEKNILSNAFQFALADILTLIARKLPQKDLEKIRIEVEKQKKISGSSQLSYEQILKIIRLVFQEVVGSSQAEEIFQKKLEEEYRLVCLDISRELKARVKE